MPDQGFVAKRVAKCLEGVEARGCGGVGWRVSRVLGDGHAVNFHGPILQVEEVKKVVYAHHAAQPLPWTPYCGMTRIFYVLKGGVEWAARHPTKGDRRGGATTGDAVVLSSRGGAVVQMTVAAGVEMLHGIEVWVKEPMRCGVDEPLMDTYRHVEFPKYEGAKWTATVLAGTFDEPGGTPPSPVETCTPVNVIDFAVERGGALEYPVPEGWVTSVYVYQGAVELQSNMEVTPAGTLTTFEWGGDLLDVWARGDDAAEVSRFLVICAAPFTEGVERQGTLVAASRNILDDIRRRPGLAEAAAGLQKLRRRALKGGGDPEDDQHGTPQRGAHTTATLDARVAARSSAASSPRRAGTPCSVAHDPVPSTAAVDAARPARGGDLPAPTPGPPPGAQEQELAHQVQKLRELQAQGVPGLELAIEECEKGLREAAEVRRARRSTAAAAHDAADTDRGTSPRRLGAAADGNSADGTAAAAAATDMKQLHADMVRYREEWSAYSAQWVGYLRALHEEIAQAPGDDALREEYATKTKLYKAELATYNEKVRLFNERKRQAGQF